MENSNKFKIDFKFYKQKCPPPDYSKVVDFSNVKDENNVQKICLLPSSVNNDKMDDEESFIASLMAPPSEWSVYELMDKPGLLFVNNPFMATGQRYWIHQCLRDYTRRPSRLNIDAHNVLDQSQDWWDICQRDDHDCQPLRKKLRWATLGYHHNWDSKVYSENMKDSFPTELAALSRYVSRILYGQQDFSAEAAIVNFYHFDSTLSGHTDHSEMDMSAPLFSFSFGQTAIFLLGGTSLDIAPSAIYIKSGDIVVMSKQSRQCYHGVPKILPAGESPWNLGMNSEGESVPCNLRVANNSETSPVNSINSELIKHISEDALWKPFENYIQQSRINMNVRQVLCKGEESLNIKKS